MRPLFSLPVLFVFLVLIASLHQATGMPQSPDSMVHPSPVQMMWHEPVDMEHLDLFYGIGGKENEPDPATVYKYVGKMKPGTQSKMIVVDDRNRKWVLKTGPEARPETTATRIVWAAGYYVDQDYFLNSVRIAGDTTFTEDNVRFERFLPAESDLGRWEWKSNPFMGTRELDGLKVLVALLRDADVKSDNNEIRRVTDNGVPTDVYYIADLGSTLGSTGTAWNRVPFFRNLPADHLNHKKEKANPDRFEKGSFIDKVDGDEVDFAARRSSVKSVIRGVSVENAVWIGDILGRLSDAQLSDAFRAGGFNAEETQTYVATLRERINELRNLTAH